MMLRLPPTIAWRRSIAFVAYLASIIAATMGLMPLYAQIPFLLYAIYIFFVLHQRHQNVDAQRTEPDIAEQRFFSVLTLLSFLSILITRLSPFARFGEAPLGYDTGFYWQIFRLIIPAGTIVNAAGAEATGSHLAYAPWFPVASLGLSALETIHFLHVINQLLLASALYVLLRSISPQKHARAVAACGVFLFAMSTTQFIAYWWMFYKQSFALPFFIFALALFFRRSWLAIPVVAFAAAIHLPSAIPFGIGFALFILLACATRISQRQPIDRDVRWLMLGGALAVLLTVALKGPNDLRGYFELFLKYRGIATTAQAWEVEQIRGLFIPFSVVRLASLYYLPFVLVGLLSFRSWLARDPAHRHTILVTAVVSLLVLVSFPFMHQHRSLIILDILLLAFAVEPFMRFVQSCLKNRIGQLTLVTLCSGFILFSAQIIQKQQPQLYADEAAELKVLQVTGDASDIRKDDDYVMVTSSLYTPWAYAYTGFGLTIAPGWLAWNKWDLNMWREFWLGDDNERRLDLLRMYGDHTIYIFIGRHVLAENAPLHTFLNTDPHFTRFSPHIWEYSPNLVPDIHGPPNSPV